MAADHVRTIPPQFSERGGISITSEYVSKSVDDLVVTDAFLFHHFRGVAKAHFKPLDLVDSFPCTTSDSTLPVRLNNG